MASKNVKVGSRTYEISYEILNPKADACVLFLHGWGANKELMKKAFGAHLTKFRHIYVDLAGFGASSIGEPLTTKDYAKIVSAFLRELGLCPRLIAGHSFGGKVAVLLNPPILALLSSAGIVEPKPFLVRAKIAIFKFFKILGFGKFYKIFASKDVSGMSRTMYETLKNVVNEDFSAKFADFNGRALIFWGESDRATSLKSGEKIHSLIKNSEFFPLSGDHFFFLLHAGFICEQMERILSADEEKFSLRSDEDPLDSGIESVREIK
ncbi:MAG: alpha/beta fold hydrolase [Campylobacter sp.]